MRDLDRLFSDGKVTMTKREWLKTMPEGEFEAAINAGNIDEVTVTKSEDDPPF